MPDPSLLGEVLDGHDRVLVFCHMNPDPDSIASGLAMSQLLQTRFGKEVVLCYRGIVGRAENREMVRLLAPDMCRFRDVDNLDYTAAVLVDAQPEFGFNPGDLQEQDVPLLVCIDHHPFVESTQAVPFHDVRPLGATSTIMTQYLKLYSVVPTSAVATALYYGIKTDTLGLTRRTTDDDREAYQYLGPLVNHQVLARIESPPLTRDYFRLLRNAIDQARIYGDLVVTHLGPVPYPDLVAEIADLLLKVENASWSACMGYFQDMMFVSVRTNDAHGDAGVFIRKAVQELGQAGGHNTMAAARIPLDKKDPAAYEKVRGRLHARMLNEMAEREEDGRDLVA